MSNPACRKLATFRIASAFEPPSRGKDLDLKLQSQAPRAPCANESDGLQSTVRASRIAFASPGKPTGLLRFASDFLAERHAVHSGFAG